MSTNLGEDVLPFCQSYTLWHDFGSQEGWSTEIIGEMNCCSVYAITARYRELAGSSCRYGHESLSVGSVYSDIKKYATNDEEIIEVLDEYAKICRIGK